MAEPLNRLGIFLVPVREEATFSAAVAAADAQMFDENGLGPTEAWFRAQHAVFEQLLERSVQHAVVIAPAAVAAYSDFTEQLTRAIKRPVEELSPLKLREAVSTRLGALKDAALRAAFETVLASPVADAGLWVMRESALPSAPAPEDDDGDDLDAAEVARRLEAFVAEGDARRLDPLPRGRVSLCELTAADARYAASSWDGVDREDLEALARAGELSSARARSRATATDEKDDSDTLVAMRALVSLIERRAPAYRAGLVFEPAAARELLSWLEGQRTVGKARPVRGWVLGALERAVAHESGLAIVISYP